MDGTRRRQGALLLLTLTVLALLTAMVLSVVQRPAPPTAVQASRVVVVGVPGLAWSQVDAEMPHLARWADSGAAGNLVVRGARLVTCDADGWLTLGAGQRAAAAGPSAEDPEGCWSGVEPVTGGDAPPGGALVPEMQVWQEGADGRPLDARLGSLARAVGSEPGLDESCVMMAHGPLAALGAADGEGQVAAYRAGTLTEWAGPSGCPLDLVDTGTATAAEIDTALARWEPQLPEGSLLVVAGLSDSQVEGRAALHPVVLHTVGSDETPGLLVSTTTRQPGLVQTADLTATLVDVLGAPVPDHVAGRPVTVRPVEDGTVDRLRDVGAAATGVSVVQGWVSAAVLAGLVVVLGGVLLALRRRPASRWRTALAVTGTAAMAAPVAGHLSALVPWWRVGLGDLPGERSWWGPGVALSLAVLALIALVLLVAWGGPWRRDPLGPIAVVAAVTVVALGVDVIAGDGDHLSLTSVVGVAPLRAGRFYGIGNVAFGILSAAGLILAGCLASWLQPRRWAAAAAVLVTGGSTAAIGGVPVWGADFGGIPAMVASTAVLALAAAGLRLTAARVLLIGLAAVLVSATVMVLDWARGPQARTHLGDFVQSALDGEALGIVLRKLDQNAGMLVAYPASWIAVVLLALILWGVADAGSPPGRAMAPLWRVPMVRSTTWALLVCWLVGWAMNDSGIAIVGLGITVAVGAAISLAARVTGPGWVSEPTTTLVPGDAGAPPAAAARA
ncbi:hypothetical protein [Ornithinimicrobium sediminis]|uniref:hypothetical protein n=1 Tax=Ornithinimicrobium sediminis TaxID=2904603 RepID=UPI001E5CB19B|nr:hypothetical protein [Ornithinimicrobium sediminis]MCE0486817.1 hypothetical protein [Ornithinimicrobium sediminis]